MPKAVLNGQTLVAFARNLRKQDCVVCALPVEVREQLADARKHKITRAVQIEWLKTLGHTVTDGDLNAHTNGRHDVS